MKHKAASWLSILGILLLLGQPLGARGAGPEPTWGATDATGVYLVSSSSDVIVLDVVAPRPEVKEVREDGEAYHQVRVSGFATWAQPGAPELPVQGVMLGIPPGAIWKVELESTDRVVMEGPYRILPAPSLKPAPDSAVSVAGERKADERVYKVPVFFPAEVVEVVDSGYLRDQRFLALRVYPVRYNPMTGVMEWYRRMRVRIRLSGADAMGAGNGEQGGYYEPVLRATILNYEQAKSWRTREPSAIGAQASATCGTGPQYKVIVDAGGMHQITYGELAAAGFPAASIDPREITMCFQGQEVAIRVLGEEDGTFDPADRILFYAVVPYSRYTGTSTYWLSTSEANGKRMGAKDGAVNPATPYVPSHTVTAVAEENHLYSSKFPMPKGDHWYWDDLQGLDYSPYTPRTYTIQLQELPAGTANAVLRVGLQGYTASLHELNISFNGTLLGSRQWAGQDYRTLSLSVATPLLRAGANTLTLASKDKGAHPDVVWLDMFSVEYRAQNVALEGKSLTFLGQTGPARYWLTGFSDASVELYDVTDVQNPALVTGIGPAEVLTVRLPSVPKQFKRTSAVGRVSNSPNGAEDVGRVANPPNGAAAGRSGIAFQGNEAAAPTYWAGTGAALMHSVAIAHDPVTNWRSPTRGADYIIITDPELSAEANRLAAHHQAEGLQVLVAYVEDIYDEFNYGQDNPEAIRTFLQYAYDEWTLRPSYVLLLGDGNYDYRDYFGYGGSQMVPPWLGMVNKAFDSAMTETASDNRYSAVHGSDILPDLYIGRLPAASVGQARAMVDKILQYAATPAQDGWNKRIVLVSDNYRDEHDVRVEADDFIASSEAVYDTYVAPPYTGTRIYYDPSPSGAGLPGRYTNAAAAKAAVLANFNQGALLWNYMGHSSEVQWAIEVLLHANDVPSLANGMRLPFLLGMTCYTGQFHKPNSDPKDDALDEQLIRLPTGGTIASWSPTGEGLAAGHDVMQQAFYETVFAGGIRQLGPAIKVGTIHAYSAGYSDLVDTFLLLGDPALFLR